MKRIYLLAAIIILTGISATGFSQKKENPGTWFKTGSVLNYHLLNTTKEYDFIVSDLIMDNNIAFSWKMTEPVNYAGKIKIFSAAIDTATIMVNYFKDGSSQNMVNKTTCMLSRKIYKLLKGQQAVNLTIDDKIETINFVRNEKYPVKIDGVQQDLDVMVAESATGTKIWILDYPQYPLIVKMEVAFTIDLRSVETAK